MLPLLFWPVPIPMTRAFAGVLLCLGGAEGVGDALVGGVGLPVDAVGVDLAQDGDAVPSAAGDLSDGHPGVEPQRHRRVLQVIRAAAQRRPALRFGEGSSLFGRYRSLSRSMTASEGRRAA
jgi:hypothetical protein